MNIIIENVLKHQIEKESHKFICPHFPGGVMTPADLRKIADACEMFPNSKIKLSGEITIGNITDPKENDACRAKLGLSTFSIAGFAIRPVKVCAGGYTCDNNLQDSFSLALKLDKKFAGVDVPFKLIISVSGCGRCCSEPQVKDIGLVASRKGYAVYAGGAAGGKPRIAVKIADNVSDDRAVEIIEKIVQFYQKKGKPMERLGALIDKTGLELFKGDCGLNRNV
ncbi:MAG: NAD(P)/FAD-dependent oxidoreductase [Candidatus Omnitrophica bacterium]|nr:NAD(P)/FAD-dependent oxidoreductase [Candidatus Omnitrophota bacterium]